MSTPKFPDIDKQMVELQPETGRVVVDLTSKQKADEVIDREIYAVAKNLLRRYLPAFKAPRAG